ncbi:MAG: MlaD family protein [Gammaproteobacteria bacterium]|nr:MlaD family protein [Gammaproteobacteria bacterium]
MKKENTNYFMVGIFVLAGLALFLIMLFKITGGQSNSDEYFVEFDNVTGIKDGIVVTYGGYAIGAVNGVEPVFNSAKTVYKLSLRVKSNWKIPDDSTAQIVMPAIISDKQIEISQGTSTEYLSPGDTLKSAEAVDIMELVDSIASQLNEFIPQSTKNVNALIAKLNHSANKVSILLSDENIRHMNNIFKHADSSGKSLSELALGFTRINKQLDSILSRTDLILNDNSEDIRYTVIELKKSIDVVSGRIESVMYNLDATSQNMNEFSRELRNNPGVILGSKPPVDK